MLHSHTQFCDGRASMEEMASAAFESGLSRYGFSPHSPIPIESPCNMAFEDVPAYIKEAHRLRDLYAGRMEILTGMEVDYLSAEWGPHNPYYHEIGLDYRIGSVHFVPNQKGVPYDCDGSPERFARNLVNVFGGDLRYVVEKYFSQVRDMIARGGFEILGHADKIATNASAVDPSVEDQDWYRDLFEATLREAVGSGVTLEINTKAFEKIGRFFPAERWWDYLRELNPRLIINSDAHYPGLILAGMEEARRRYFNG